MRFSWAQPILALSILLFITPASLGEESQHTTAAPDDTNRARTFFQHGVTLYGEGDFDGARVEFRRAYELVPSFRVLFNLGRVAVELHDYAAAINSFTRYLKDGGDQIPAERKGEVQEEIARLRPRVGTIHLLTAEPGDEVYIDDLLVGRTPLAPLTVNVGRRRLEVKVKLGSPEVRVVDVPGEETVIVRVPRHASVLPPPQLVPPIIGQSSSGSASAPARSSSYGLWLGWTATGLCAAGAAVFATMAYRSSRDLEDLRHSYPVTRDALDAKERSTRISSAVADGLAAGALILGGFSLYYTLTEGHRRETSKPRLFVDLAWPGAVQLEGSF